MDRLYVLDENAIEVGGVNVVMSSVDTFTVPLLFQPSARNATSASSPVMSRPSFCHAAKCWPTLMLPPETPLTLIAGSSLPRSSRTLTYCGKSMFPHGVGAL